MVEGVRDFSEVSTIRVLIPFMRALPSGPSYFPKMAPPNIATLEDYISTNEFGDGGAKKHFFVLYVSSD